MAKKLPVLPNDHMFKQQCLNVAMFEQQARSQDFIWLRACWANIIDSINSWHNDVTPSPAETTTIVLWLLSFVDDRYNYDGMTRVCVCVCVCRSSRACDVTAGNCAPPSNRRARPPCPGHMASTCWQLDADWLHHLLPGDRCRRLQQQFTTLDKDTTTAVGWHNQPHADWSDVMATLPRHCAGDQRGQSWTRVHGGHYHAGCRYCIQTCASSDQHSHALCYSYLFIWLFDLSWEAVVSLWQSLHIFGFISFVL